MFVALTEFLLRDAQAMETTFLVGMLGVVVLVLVMPLRAAWVVYRHLRATPGSIRQPGLYRAALLLLGLAIYGVLEVVYYFAHAKGGEVSGVMIPLFSLIPFFLYVAFEILYALSRRGPLSGAGHDQPNQR
jgi:hypothetical protein